MTNFSLKGIWYHVFQPAANWIESKPNYITFGRLSMLSGCYTNELQNSRRLNLWVRFLIQLCKNAIIIKQRPHTWSTVWKTIWNMWKWCVVNLFWYQTISKNQVHYPGLMQWCVCSSIMYILFCRGRLRIWQVYCFIVGRNCVTITWQQIFKGSLQIMVEGVLRHVTVERSNLVYS